MTELTETKVRRLMKFLRLIEKFKDKFDDVGRVERDISYIRRALRRGGENKELFLKGELK